jgi:hypothetical protein
MLFITIVIAVDDKGSQPLAAGASLAVKLREIERPLKKYPAVHVYYAACGL